MEWHSYKYTKQVREEGTKLKGSNLSHIKVEPFKNPKRTGVL